MCSVVDTGQQLFGVWPSCPSSMPTPGYASCICFRYLIKFHSFLIYDTSGCALRVYSSFNNIYLVTKTSQFLTEIQNTALDVSLPAIVQLGV